MHVIVNTVTPSYCSTPAPHSKADRSEASTPNHRLKSKHRFYGSCAASKFQHEGRTSLSFKDSFLHNKTHNAENVDAGGSADVQLTLSKRLLSGDQIIATYLSGRLRQVMMRIFGHIRLYFVGLLAVDLV